MSATKTNGGPAAEPAAHHHNTALATTRQTASDPSIANGAAPRTEWTVFVGSVNDGQSGDVFPLEWASLLDDIKQMSDCSPTAAKGAAGYFVAAGVLGKRCDANTGSASAIVVDYEPPPGTPVQWGSWPAAAIAYTTATHEKVCPENPTGAARWRVILQVLEPVPATEYTALRRVLEPQLPAGSKIRGRSQPAYFPTGEGVQYERVLGAPLDWRALPLTEHTYRVRNEREPSAVQCADADAAIASELACIWQKNTKGHQAFGALGGVLYDAGVSAERAENIAALLADAVETTHSDPIARVLEAYDDLHEMGWPKLIESLCGNGVGLPDAPGSPASTRIKVVINQVERMIKSSVAPSVVVPQAAMPSELVANAPTPFDEKRSDLGNARRLVRMHGNDLRYFMARRCWLVWDGARWRADDTGEIARRAKSAAESFWFEAKREPDDEKRKAAFAWAAQCQNQGRIASMITLAESEPGIPVTANDLDSNPWLLNVLNGTLDLRNGHLSQPDRSLLMTKVCATSFEPGARSALWDRVITDLFGDDHELRDYVQRAMGYALFGAWREKRFWFGYGPPDGGKSTFLGAIGDVLGDYHVTADATTWMIQSNNGGNRGDVTRLLGARLVTSLEVRASARFDQQLMKKVTGGDELTYAAKYENDISFKPTFGLWFGANDRPVIPDDDDGFWNRVACVPFTRVVPKERQDKELREKLASAEHAPAVLAWLVAGCLEWQRVGLGTCAAVAGATAAYKRDMNQAARFFDDCCEKGEDYNVPASLLRSAYEEWCRSDGVKHPLQGKAFGARIRALGATGNDDETRVHGQKTWWGVRLRRHTDD